MRSRTAAVALSAVAVLSGLAVVTAAPASAAPKPVKVQLLAFNDFHGALQPPTGSGGRMTLADGTTVDAGGLAYFCHAPRGTRAGEQGDADHQQRRPHRW
jgi:5'-nucleotidase